MGGGLGFGMSPVSRGVATKLLLSYTPDSLHLILSAAVAVFSLNSSGLL